MTGGWHGSLIPDAYLWTPSFLNRLGAIISNDAFDKNAFWVEITDVGRRRRVGIQLSRRRWFRHGVRGRDPATRRGVAIDAEGCSRDTDDRDGTRDVIE